MRRGGRRLRAAGRFPALPPVVGLVDGARAGAARVRGVEPGVGAAEAVGGQFLSERAPLTSYRLPLDWELKHFY